MDPQDRGLSSQIGPVQVDWPRSAGYYGGVALAVGAGMIEWPLGVFIAAIPFIKMLNLPGAPLPVRLVSQMLDGASKPVGGDGDSVIKVQSSGERTGSGGRSGGIAGQLHRGLLGVWDDARSLQ